MNDNAVPGTPQKGVVVAIQEIRFVVADNGGVKAYVLCKTAEKIIGLDGWHFKQFPPGTPIDMILALMFTKDPFGKWPLSGPDDKQPIGAIIENFEPNQTQESPRTDS